MYYLMDWRINEEKLGLNLADLDVIPDFDIPWTMGVYWEDPISQPIKLNIDPDSGTDMPDAFFVGIPLFSERLLNLLNSWGVDNIQTYDALLTDARNNHVYNNYKAVNIVGMVSCANLEKSKYIEGSGPPLMYFEHLIIDEGKISGSLMIRLAESASVILVTEKIAKKIIDGDFVGVRLLELNSN